MARSRSYDDPDVLYNDGPYTYTYDGQLWDRNHPEGRPLASTAVVQIGVRVTGNQEGASDLDSITLINSSAVASASQTSATTSLAAAASISIPSSGRFLILLPASTNTAPIRFTGSTSETGILLSSQNASCLSVVGGTTVYLYSTAGSVVPVRTLIY